MDFYLTYIQPFTSWLHAHPHLAGLITFFVSFSESLALVGSIVPGSVTMTAIGMLIGTGVIPALPTFIWAILGAIAGDSASYFLGYYYHEKLSSIWPFRKYPGLIASGSDFFKQHGGKSVFVGRFLGPLRSIIPVIAGMMRMPNNRFLIANITSAILWSLLYILPGVFLGSAASELSPQVASKVFLITLIALILIWLISWFAKFLYQTIKLFIERHLQQFWQWMNKHPSLFKVANYIANPEKPHDYRQIALLFFSTLSLCLFLIIAFSALERGYITHFDKPAFTFLQSIRVPNLDIFFTIFSFLADKKVLIIFLFSVFFYFVLTKKKWEAVHWLSNGIVSSLTIFILKLIIHLPRPQGLVQIRHGYSFPSGHTTFGLALFGFFAYFIGKNTTPTMRRFVIYPFALLAGCIAFSRVYLGMHWLSDIVGSIFLASTILSLHLLSYRRYPQPKVNKYHLLLIALLVLPAATGLYMINHFENAIKGSQLKKQYQLMTYEAWWNTTNHLPVYRKNRFGKPVSVLNVQWAMPLNQIYNHLNQQGWEKSNHSKLAKKITGILTSKEPHLSFFHKLYNNEPPSLILIKPPKVLRLWASQIVFRDVHTPLWVGTITYLKHEHTPLLAPHKASSLATERTYSPSKLLSTDINGLNVKTIIDNKEKVEVIKISQQ